MAFNGSGVFVRAIPSWVTDALSFNNITASRIDTENDAIAAGLSNTICRDGQSTITANITFSNFKLTNLDDAEADTDALNRQTGDGRYIQSAKSGGDTGIFANDGLKIYDTNNSHVIIITPGSNITANRTLTITTGDSDRTITIAGDGTLRYLASRIGTTTSSATPQPDADAHDQFNVTALGEGATFAAPSGTPTNGQKLIIRIKDDGTARSLAFNAIYRAIACTLPTTTVLGKTTYIGAIYNSADSKWDVLGVATEA